MKKLIEISVNGYDHTDAVITYFMNPDRDSDGKIVFTNQDDMIAKLHGSPAFVDIYAYHGQNLKPYLPKISISTASIKALYKAIIAIEETTSEEFCDW